jgi:hypothetical protein
MNAHLETYLNDHLAGSDSALDLLTRLEEKYANMTLDLAEVRAEVQEDQKELKTIMARLNSPYRFIINPIVDYVLDLEEKNHDREVAVLVPELVEDRWYYYLLHNQRAAWLKALLLLKGNQRIIVIDVPWYLNS